MKSTNNRTSNDRLDDLLDSFNKPWIFKSESKDVEIPIKLIEDKNINFLKIISDLYFIESINRLEYHEKQKTVSIDTIKNRSAYHTFMIFSKYFYQSELRKHLKILKKDINEHFNLFFPNFENISYVWSYLLGDELYHNKLIVMIIFYNLILNEFKNYESLNGKYHKFSKKIAKRLNNELKQFSKDVNRDELITSIYASPIEYNLNKFDKLISQCQIFLMGMSLSDLDIFESDLSILKEIINEIKEQISSVDHLKKILKNDVNCIATMKFSNNKYISINGLDSDTPNSKIETYNNRVEIIEIIKKIACEKKIEIEFVELSPNTKYYFKEGNESITYEMYQNYKYQKENRMFTCCERKLFAKADLEINKTKNNHVNIAELTIAIQPCVLCQRSIKIVNETKNFEIITNNPEKPSKIKPKIIKRMDEIAQKIYNINNNS